MTLSFEVQAESKALNILKNHPYCLITPIDNNLTEGEPVKCTDINIIRDMYYDNYDIMIHTPDGCNY